MKRNKMISMSLLIGLFLVLSSGMYAQDFAKAAPGISTKVILDNEKVRVIETEFAPGAITDWHSHPNYVVYALTDGKMEMTDKGKPAIIVDFKAGNATYHPAVTHQVKNMGTTPVKMIVTELKPAAPKKMNAKPAPSGKK